VGDKKLNWNAAVVFGNPEQVAVERGLADFRSGRPVVITSDSDGSAVALPVDGLTDQGLTAFRHLCGLVRPTLLITSPRARALGIEVDEPIGLTISDDDDAATIMSLAADVVVDPGRQVVATGHTAGAAIELAKLAHRIPALVMVDDDAIANAPATRPLMRVSAAAVAQFRKLAAQSLVVAAEANVPLNGGTPARFVVFRDAIGGGSVAVIIGTPDVSRPVPVRVHSACLTGDVFGSRRCDCGDQLRLAITQLEEQGGGIILYLEQEGRGLGLANKMRTYQLQDVGLDTIDANATLGFEDDERDYGAAVRMLQLLGCTRVLLLTNNPAKLDGLAQAGIEVSGRIPLHGPVNADNRRYLTAKATRAGHKLDHLLATLTETESAERIGGDRTS